MLCTENKGLELVAIAKCAALNLFDGVWDKELGECVTRKGTAAYYFD